MEVEMGAIIPFSLPMRVCWYNNFSHRGPENHLCVLGGENMLLGLDFGTTNTGAAVFDGRSLNLLPLDPVSQSPAICRTAMYFTRDGQYYFGQDAINRYFEQNLGRRTKLNRVWVGEIMQVFAELPVFYRDVFVYEDEFWPG